MTEPNYPRTPPPPAGPPTGSPRVAETSAIDENGAAKYGETAEQVDKRKPWLFGGAGLVIGVLLGLGLSAAISGGSTSAVITDAVETCGVEESPGISLGDAGQSITMNTAGDESSGADYADVVCVLSAIETPDSVSSRMSSTRALDGRQTGEWDGLSASWGYHPDDGLNVVIEMNQD
ncbi:hypothetical protein [Arthrobacter roseus]|uniref:hypothetical protein n=1 Tax=Arthrobacter roseus TaxID=136274 RepID=UPI001964D397|nr:hypothetical protein [Arthrobacter roseus]MBM7846835.1 hypothetical protein [Arthrobacter roseus]